MLCFETLLMFCIMFVWKIFFIMTFFSIIVIMYVYRNKFYFVSIYIFLLIPLFCIAWVYTNIIAYNYLVHLSTVQLFILFLSNVSKHSFSYCCSNYIILKSVKSIFFIFYANSLYYNDFYNILCFLSIAWLLVTGRKKCTVK